MNKSNLRLVTDPKKEVVMHKTNQESIFTEVGSPKKTTNPLTQNNLQHTKNEDYEIEENNTSDEIIEEAKLLSPNEVQVESDHLISGTSAKSTEFHNASNPPNFPNSLYTTLPDFLKRVIAHADSVDERDILILGSLVTTGSCLTNVFGNLRDEKLHPNLFMFLSAEASSGKGRISFCKKLVQPIHKAKRQKSEQEFREYEQSLQDGQKTKYKEKGELSEKPTIKMLFIPANSSSTAVYQTLYENNSEGLIFETEGDVLTSSFKSEHGDYSSGFRKAFHHETISYRRRTNDEFREIEEPKLSALLTGTPMQIRTLIPNAENGLFSRFIFYRMRLNTSWIPAYSAKISGGLGGYFDNLGNEFFELYNEIIKQGEIEFNLTEVQWKKYNTFFEQQSKRLVTINGIDFVSIVRRYGVIFFRIAMILSVFRAKELNSLSSKIICKDIDFDNAYSLVSVLLQHSAIVFSLTPKSPKPKIVKTREQEMLEQLPLKFNRQDLYNSADKLSIAKKSADKLLVKLVKSDWVQKKMHNSYVNVSKLKTNSGEIV